MITPRIIGLLTVASVAVCDENVLKKSRTSTFAQNNPEGTGFEELVKRGTFVDKTLFIKDFLDKRSAKVVLITNPNGFGKSTNVEMLTKFLKKDLYSSGNELEKYYVTLFTNQQVSSENHLKDYQGQFPVISVSFKGISGESYERMMETFVETVLRKKPQGIYESNSLLGPAMSSYITAGFRQLEEATPFIAALDKFQQLLAGPLNNITESTLVASISHLSFIFNALFQKKTFVFVDDFDHPLVEASTKANPEDQKKITRFFERLFEATFKNNTNLERGLITGVMSLTKSFSSGFSGVEEYSILHNKFYKYFGFTWDEVEKLLDKRGGIPVKLRKKAEYLYNGYRTADNLSRTLYHPVAMSHFLRNRRIDPWERSETTQKIAHFFRDNTVRQVIRDLIIGEQVNVELDTSFKPDTLRFLSEIDGQERKIRSVAERDQVLSLLFLEGYLTLDDREENRTRSFDGPKVNASLCLPTRLEKQEFANLMVKYVPKPEKKLFSIMEEVAENLRIVLSKKSDKNVGMHKRFFESALKKYLNEYQPFTLLKPSKAHLWKKETYLSQEFLHFVTNMLAVTLTADYFEIEISTQKKGDRTALLIMDTETLTGMVLEVRFYLKPQEMKVHGRSPTIKRTLSKRAREGFVQAKNPFVDLQDIVFMDVSVGWLQRTGISVKTTLRPV